MTTYGSNFFIRLSARIVLDVAEEEGLMPLTAGTIAVIIKRILRKKTPSRTTCVRLLYTIARENEDSYKLLWGQRIIGSNKGYPRLALFPLTKKTKTLMLSDGWRVFLTEKEAKRERALVMVSNRTMKRQGG